MSIRRNALKLGSEPSGVTSERLAVACSCSRESAASTLSRMKAAGRMTYEEGVYRTAPAGAKVLRMPERRRTSADTPPELRAFADWLAERFAKHTVRMYLSTVRRALAHPGGPNGWLKQHITRTMPARSAMVYVAAVNAWGAFSGDDGVGAVALPRGVVDRTAKVEPLEREQLMTLLSGLAAKIPARTWTIIVLLAFTGARVSEVCELRAAGVIERAGRLSIRIVGKGGVQREVPVVGKGAEALTYWMASRPNQASPWLFTVTGRAPVNPESVRSVLRAIKVDGRRLHPHVFRHTAATLLLENGVDLATVRDLFGHASISTTGLYAHSTDRSRREAMERLADVMNSREEDF